MKSALLLSGIMIVAGCTTDRMTDPAIVTVVKDKHEFTALTTTADRRIFIINSRTNRTCGEPPAGVAENISASLSNSLSLAVKAGATQPEGKNSFAESAAKTVANVSQKTQGLMLYEAMSSGLCMAFANDPGMTATQYIESLINAGRVTAPLIESELQASRGKIGPSEKTLETPSTVLTSPLAPVTDVSTSGNEAAATAVAAGAAATAIATQNAAAGQAAGVAISQSLPDGASSIEKEAIVKQVTEQAVTKVVGNAGLGQKAGEKAASAFSRSPSDSAQESINRNVLKALDNMGRALH